MKAKAKRVSVPDIHLFQTLAGEERAGAETFFERLAIQFHRRGLPQTLAVRPYPDRVAQFEREGIKTIPCKFRGALKVLQRQKIKRAIRASDADVVLSWMNRATNMTPKVEGVPHVGRLGGFYKVKRYQHCDWLVSNTKGIADYLLREGWPKERLHVQFNFVPDGKDIAPLCASTENRLPKDTAGEPVFVSLGRFHHDKGFDTLLKALAKVPHGQLLLAGIGEEEQALMTLADDLGISNRVHFIPWQNNPQSFIKSGDIFICPSRHEPFGNVIAEALSCSMPIITTASEGATEFATHGKDALVTPIDDVDAMADAMRVLANDAKLRKQLGNAGYQTFLKRFTTDKVVDEWFEFLGEVVR